jgi:hypothetical protein
MKCKLTSAKRGGQILVLALEVMLIAGLIAAGPAGAVGTWEPQSTGLTGIDLWGVDFINADTGWVVGSHLVSGGAPPTPTLRTVDGGNTWSPQSSGT